jgi:biopolymer transport protein TolQ
LKKTSQAGESLEPADGAAQVHPTFAFGARFAATDNVKRASMAGDQYGDDPMTRWPFLATTGNTTPFIGLFEPSGDHELLPQHGPKGRQPGGGGARHFEALVTTAAGSGRCHPAVIALTSS